jgi:hypothetical protein
VGLGLARETQGVAAIARLGHDLPFLARFQD